MPPYLVTCPACGTGNRVPAEKEGLSGLCGTCHKKLPPLYIRPINLAENSFDTFVQSYESLVLAEFWAPW